MIINVGILSLFKYIPSLFSAKSIIAPVGISFYTLQMLGYLFDVSRKTCNPQKNFLKYALFAEYFPQLLSGPINRYSDMNNQLYTEKYFDYKAVTFGLQRILWGFFKKLVISERLRILVDCVYNDYTSYSSVNILFATICFAFQLYTDFSGYMDIALGVSETFGIRMAENFETPFLSRSISEYWRRWHITLGTWFKDYLFYPILKSDLFVHMGDSARKRFGKKRGKKIPVYFGMFILWFFVGFWHGGAWKYIFGSGLLHWFYIVSGQILEPFFKKLIKMFSINTDHVLYHLFQTVRTFCLVCIGFIFFRAASLTEGFMILIKTLNIKSGIHLHANILQLGLDLYDIAVLLITLIILFIISLLHQKYKVREIIAKAYLPIRWLIYYLLLYSTIILGQYGPGFNASEFIYKNF